MMSRRQPRYSKGDRIGGRFLVHQALMGGMGEVYLCLDEQQMLPFALKTFQGSSPALAHSFKEEVSKWIALEKHPNIVRCLWMDRLDNTPFMALEWVAGEEGKGTDLRSWLQHGPLDLPLAVRFTIDIVRGLIHANEKSPGIVHRDLKPDNVLVNQSRQAKITDFGLATVAQIARLRPDARDMIDLGQSNYVGNIVGTPAYMPPEQWRGEADIDFRADMYAAGCILYELLTGRWLYTGTTISELRTQHLESAIPALSGNFSPDIKAILAGCLAKRREDRFARLDQLLSDLIKLYKAHSDESLPEITAGAFTAVDYNNRGATYGYLGRLERAIADFDAAIRLDPNDSKAYYNRGTSYVDLGQHEQAIADFDAAIRLDPNFAQAYHNRGNSYGALGHHKRAIADYDAAIHLDSNFVQAYSNRGTRYRALGQHERAIADFDAAIRLDPNFAQAYSNRGTSYGDLGQHERAIADFDAAIRLDQNYAQAYSNRGTSYVDLGQYEQAIADFDAAIRLDPNLARAYFNRGNSYADLGLHERATADFDAAIRLDPNYATAYYNRGINYADLGLHERAIADYDAAIRLDPNYVQAYFNKGVQLANTGRLQESLPCFAKAYELGLQQAAGAIQQVRQMLGLPPMQMQVDPNDPQAAFEAFAEAGSLDAMRHVIAQFPILTQMIPTIEQVINEQILPEHRPTFEQKLAWLRAVMKDK